MLDFTLLIGIFLVVLLAFANGANDVSKGIATLVGSGVTDYRKAIFWGAFWTVSGGLLGTIFSLTLVKTFTKDILSGDVNYSILLSFAVLGGTIAWVSLASRLGLPVSTTHSITGAICGAALVSIGLQGVQWSSLIHKIVLPLLLSPLLSLAVTFLIFPLLRRGLSGWEGHCLCVLPAQPAQVVQRHGNMLRVLPAEPGIMTFAGTAEECQGKKAVSLTLNLDSFHWLTSGLVSFARGLNDAPKIVALLVTFSLFNGMDSGYLLGQGFVAVALGMGLGSWLAGRRVTQVLAEKVTRMDHLQGFSANLTTAILVISAAKFGFPVSTTHVSSCAIMGVGLRQGKDRLDWKLVAEIILAWLMTLPMSGLLAAGIYWLLTSVK
jgi:PiT family inorganic phosphate transporter